ncbi:hypothetical protein MAPG_02084 [Magnaporthiopsis poae ATCC 64411]|uniref:Uncharacterized protein n=1 Tax=Magnaporthiopsis poae (strain ATCC 64411 / 73-15) TaxID=644358 RepID=A0A0C4DQE4_MAGP6|nr:hypothetical protein MAPG_02084 [Magnaporthiopsis poae ATCC 64411]
MGGPLDVQTGTGFLALAFVVPLSLAWYNIRRLQIEQHRAWMLRAWVNAGAIITSRICFFAMLFITAPAGYATVRPCEQIDFEHYGNRTKVLARFPGCAGFYSGVNGTDPHLAVVVPVDPPKAGPSWVGSSLTLNFGASVWLSLAIHMIGVEIYLRLTPAEAERLRNISYQRQAEAGMKNPGSAGLTVDSLGDSAKWTPSSG